jgi:hypothetical protein
LWEKKNFYLSEGFSFPKTLFLLQKYIMPKQMQLFSIKIQFIILFLILNQIIIAQTTPFSLQHLEGKWFIHYSNFPMWLKGDKLNPTFTYTVGQQGSKTGLKDAVQYLKKGVLKQISGFDTPTDSTNQSFIWRGAGLLKLGMLKKKIYPIE